MEDGRQHGRLRGLCCASYGNSVWHTIDKWDSGFPLEPGPKKATLTWLRKKYAVK
ncbi:hypothetical protein Hanom_Chr16g01515281 [Helianthus anomalus]